MITARRKADGSFEVANGHMRLKIQLQIHGKAEVVDLGTGKTIHVHEVGGQVLALSEESQPDLRELLDLVRELENFDATLAAMRAAGKPIEPAQSAYDERKRKELRIVQLRTKWAI